MLVDEVRAIRVGSAVFNESNMIRLMRTIWVAMRGQERTRPRL